jgi:hypothetical protein
LDFCILNQKEFSDNIARLGVRVLAEMEISRLLSEPKELTVEFREESDYKTAIKLIEKENANDTWI